MQPASHKGARLIAALAALLVLSAALSACGSKDSGDGVAARQPMQLNVMVFKIEYGGTLASFEKVVEAVEKAAPDVVGIEEAETSTPRLAKLAGYPYFNSSMQSVSKYPILEPSGGDGVYVFIEVQPGKVVAISNVHLPSDPYGPYWVRDGKTVEKALAGAGFRDSYRQAHPDPVKDPGLTWWAARPKVPAWAGNPTAKDSQDRIDYVYATGPSKIVSSVIIGESDDPT